MKIFYKNGKFIFAFIVCLFFIQNIVMHSQCVVLGPSVTQTSCDDLNTADPLDDLITFDVVAINGTNDPAAMFEVVNPSNQIVLGTFFYDTGGPVIVEYRPNLSVVIRDVQDPDCYVTMYPTVTPCSTPNDPCATPLDNFVLVGDAVSQTNNCYQLTPDLNYKSGAIWYQNALDLNSSFTLTFTLNFGTNGTDGADGMIFILQNIANNISGDGGYLGFDGLSPSVGLEFDTFRNTGSDLPANDPGPDHMSFQRNGSLVHDNNGYLDNTVPFQTLGEIEDGVDRIAIIQWDAATNILSCSFDGETITVTQDIANTIFSGNSQVFWGWSSATGGSTNVHRVCINDIQVVDALVINSDLTHVTCDHSGAIDISVNGGVAPYTYQWSNGVTTEDLNSLTTGGIYTVTVTDDCGTSTTKDFTLTEEDCCSIIGSATQIACNDMGTADPSDDIITIQVNATNSGSSGTFSVVHVLDIYEPFDYGTGGTIDLPYSTNISLTFIDQDDLSCLDVVTLPVTPCSPPCGTDSLTYVIQGNTTQTNSTCYQLTTTSPFYQDGKVWSQNTLDLNNAFTMDFALNFGTRDAAGADGIMFILEPTGNINNNNNGGSFGFPNFPVSAGFEFDTWMNNEAGYNDPAADHLGFLTNGNLQHPIDPLDPNNLLNTLLLSNIEDGLDHQVNVTWNPSAMVLTCTIDVSNTLTIPVDLISIFGGNPNVFWGWSGSTGGSVNNQSLCINNIQIDQLTISSEVTDMTCDAPGQIDITVSGGDPSYTYLWSDGSTNEDLTNITIPGSYTVTVTDFCGAVISKDFTISDTCCDRPLTYVTQGSADHTDGNCYQLTSTTPTYQSGQVWGQNTLNLNNSFTMDFSLNFGNRDAQGADGIMFILQPDGNMAIGNGGGFGFPNFPVSAGFEFDTWMNDEDDGNFNDPAADHLGFLTNGSLLHPIDPIGNLLNTILLGDIEDGLVHQVIITWDPNTMIFSCTIDGSNTLTIPVDLINNFGGNPNVFWGWSGSTGYRVNTQTLCINSAQINQLTMASEVIKITCDTPGAIDITVSGGNPPYTYQWSDGSTNEDLTNVTLPGTYTVTVTDFCNQTITNSFTLSAPDCECSIIGSLSQIDCDDMGTSDASDDMITLQVDASVLNGGITGAFDVVDVLSSNTLATFPYSIGGTITVPYNQSISIEFRDVDDPNCIDVLSIDLQPCSLPCTDVRVSITLDNYPKETSWDLRNQAGAIIASSNGHLGQNPSGITLDWDFCLDDGCYYFTIYDFYGDGICCDPFYGNGSYTISNLNTGSVYGMGAQFGYSETVNFCFYNSLTDDCPDELDIPGVNTYVTPGTYEASQTISSDGVIIEGDVIYSAGESLYLMSGFEVTNGIEFEAIIEGCGSNE